MVFSPDIDMVTLEGRWGQGIEQGGQTAHSGDYP